MSPIIPSRHRARYFRVTAGLVSAAAVLLAACETTSADVDDEGEPARLARAFVDYGDAAEQAATTLGRAAPEIVASTLTGSRGPESLVWVGQPVQFFDASPWSRTVTTMTPEGVSVTVEAAVDRIRWQAGDGAEMTCTTPHAYGARHWQYRTWWGGSSLGCGHTYSTSSSRAGGTYLVTAIAEWSATWRTSNGHSGTLELSPRTGMTSVRVADASAYEIWHAAGLSETAAGDTGMVQTKKKTDGGT